MSTNDTEHRTVQRFMWDVLEENGFELDWVGYNADHRAIVVEYTNSSERSPQDLFVEDVPLLARALLGVIENGADPDVYQRLITFVANPESSQPRTGLRWTIDREWAKKIRRKSKLKALYRDVSKTVTSLEADGAYDVEVSLTFV